jgi:cobalamin synthase
MWVPSLCIDMYEGRTHTAAQSTTSHDERRTVGGTVAYLLALPALVAVMAAPAVSFGVALGVAGVVVGERAVRRFGGHQNETGRSPLSAESGRPA